MDKIFVLPNSIKIHFLPNKTHGIIYIYIGFNKGSLIDGYGKEGTAHIFEHMLIQLFEKNGLQVILEDNGFDVNGETDQNKMALSIETDKEHIKETISLLVNIFNSIKISKKELSIAKKVVKAEFYERYKETDNISFLLSLKNKAYKYKQFSRDENIKTIVAVKINDIKKAKRELFTKSNVFITILGCPDEYSSFIYKKFSTIQLNNKNSKKEVFVPAIRPMKDFYIPKKNIGNFSFLASSTIQNYITLEILTHHLIGWHDAVLDYYLREYRSISYGAGNYISMTGKNIVSTYYFETYSKKNVSKTIDSFSKEKFMPTIKQFNVAKRRFIVELYEKTNSDLCSYFEDIHLNISRSIKYNELIKTIRKFKYSDFKKAFDNLELIKYAR